MQAVPSFNCLCAINALRFPRERLYVLSAPLAGHARLDSDRFVYTYRSNGLSHWRHRITLLRGDHQTPGQRDFIAIDSPLKKEFELSG